MSPDFELFNAIRRLLNARLNIDVYDSDLPGPEAPYPFVFIQDPNTVEDFYVKGGVFGQVSIIIDVWQDNPRKKGTVSDWLFTIRRLLNSIDDTDSYSWCVSEAQTSFSNDNTTGQVLLRGMLQVTFKYYRR